MIFFGVIIGLVILAAMIYLAISKKSKFSTRVASLIALGIMVSSVIICVCIVLFGGKESEDEMMVIITGAPTEAPKGNTNTFLVLLFIVFLVGLLITVVILSFKEHRKAFPANKKKIKDLFIDES